MIAELLHLPTWTDERGVLTAVDSCPFPVRRAFWVTDMKGERGGHAHKVCQQLLVAVAGTVTVFVTDGDEWARYILTNPMEGLFVPSGTTVNYRGSPNAALLVLCSESYDPADYVKGESCAS